MTKVGHVNIVSIKKINEKKEIVACENSRPHATVTPLGPGAKKDGCFRRLKKLKKLKKVTANVSDSMFQEFSKLQVSWHIATSSRTHEST